MESFGRKNVIPHWVPKNIYVQNKWHDMPRYIYIYIYTLFQNFTKFKIYFEYIYIYCSIQKLFLFDEKRKGTYKLSLFLTLQHF